MVLPKNHNIQLKDSKKLSSKQRQIFAQLIKKIALDFKIAQIEAVKIDELNIHNASLEAMKKAIEAIKFKAKIILVDGLYLPKLNYKPNENRQLKAVIKGDTIYSEIQAAAILAKVYRDDLMNQYSKKYPSFSFNQHKGYLTQNHKKEIEQFGAIKKFHRVSFAPLKNNHNIKWID